MEYADPHGDDQGEDDANADANEENRHGTLKELGQFVRRHTCTSFGSQYVSCHIVTTKRDLRFHV